MAWVDYFRRFAPVTAFNSVRLVGTGKTGPDVSRQSDSEVNVTGLAVGGLAQPYSISFTAAAGGTNVCEVTITVKRATAAPILVPFPLTVWLSDAATGAGLTGTTASGTVTAKAASGAVFGTLTAKKALVVQTLATGVFVLEITDTAKTGFYVAAQLPSTGRVQVSAQLVTGNYG